MENTLTAEKPSGSSRERRCRPLRRVVDGITSAIGALGSLAHDGMHTGY